MAIIKCDEELPPADIPSGDEEGVEVIVEEYVEQDEVSLGKTLLAVESTLFLSDTLNPVLSNVSDFLLKDRPQDITDTFRADSNRYWTLDENGNMKYMNTNLYGYTDNVNADSPPPPFSFVDYSALAPTYTSLSIPEPSTTALGLDITKESHTIMLNSVYIPNEEMWNAFVDGTMYPEQSVDPEETFSRPSMLIPLGQTFTDHAFKMNTPFSKKELEMFANIEGDVDVADVESDYDFFAKAYEEGIASTTVPENALPHLYTEVEKGESNDENTTELPEGYFRAFISDVLSDQSEMNRIAENYENVAILDSYMDATYIIDSTREDIESGESATTSAFEILMSYANRENLFPMNMNIEVNTNNASDVMFNAEDVGMIDDIVRLLMGDGSIFVQTEVPTFYDGKEEEEVEENQGNNSETKTKDPEQEGVEAQSSAMPDTQEASKMEKSEDSEDSNGNTSSRGFGKTKGDLDIEIEDFGF